MLQSKFDSIDGDHALKVTLLQTGSNLSYADVIEGWRRSHEFRLFYIALLADAPFEALFWESPPVTKRSVDQPYEFVLIDSPQLSSAEPDLACFASRFTAVDADESVVAFENLSGDAVLVVPCPRAATRVYPHLTAFVRGAPEPQRHQLFRRLGEELDRRLSARPVWVSTSGLGVFWLHVRLDSRPKYYNFRPYQEHIFAANRKR